MYIRKLTLHVFVRSFSARQGARLEENTASMENRGLLEFTHER